MLCLLVAQGALAASPDNWLRHSFRRVNISTSGDAAGNEKFMKEMTQYLELDADYYLFPAVVHGYVMHDSKVATKNPGLKDVESFKSTIEAIRKGKPEAKIVAYMNARFPKESTLHPEWREIRWDGTVMDFGGMDGIMCCLNTSYTKEYLKPLMAELIKQFDVDGFWFDGIGQSIYSCACKNCQKLFKNDTGFEFPKPETFNLDNPVYRAFLRWRLENLNEHIADLQDFVKDLKPSCVIQANADQWRVLEKELNPGQGRMPCFDDQTCRLLEEGSVEMYWHHDHQGDPIVAPFNFAYLRGISGDRVVEAWSPPSIHGVDGGAVPEVDLMSRVYTAMANGVVLQLAMGWGHYDSLQNALKQIHKREAWLENAKSLKYVALVASANSRTYYGKTDPLRDYLYGVYGTMRALMEEHIPFDIIGDINLENDDLSQYKAIILEDAGALSKESLEAVRRYVKNGGGLLATGRTSLMDADGVAQKDFALADLFGAHFVAYDADTTAGKNTYPVSIPAEYYPEDQIIQRATSVVPYAMGGGLTYWGNATSVTLAESALTSLSFSGKSGAKYPFVLNNKYENGKVTYIAANAGKTYYRYSYPYVRRILANELERVAGATPFVKVDAPMAVSANYFTQTDENGKTRLIIHLLNEVGTLGRASFGDGNMPIRQEVTELSDIKIRIAKDNPMKLSGKAKAVPEMQDLAGVEQGDGMEITLPKLGLYQMIVVE